MRIQLQRIMYRQDSSFITCLALILSNLFLFTNISNAVDDAANSAPQWEAVEFRFNAAKEYDNPYTDVEFYLDFIHEDGTQIRRPGFWNGGGSFMVRFASPLSNGVWQWKSFCDTDDSGLQGMTGTLQAREPAGESSFQQHGFWQIPFGSRWMQHASGRSAVIVADTPWALPWRATHEQVEIYAKDRQAKGFNAALLMSVMPDRRMEGPRDRTQHFGFGRGFEDLPQGRLNQLNPDYFQYLDRSIDILVSHGICPVWQPVFHGYGWRGKGVAGPVVSAGEYARYCRYLVARYGAYPAVWLVLGDGHGAEPGIHAGGREIERWDAYRHPTGLHYGPQANSQAHQAKTWLDFQWIQTGHNGEHRQDRLAAHWYATPVKAIANGEPSYENTGSIGRAAGWWQGHEAWRNLCAGGTMGVVYGAGSLWNWVHQGEPTQNDGWARAPKSSWRDALDFEGSRYVGQLGHILKGLSLNGAQPDNSCTYGRPSLFKPYELLILYLEHGGDLRVLRDDIPDMWRIYDPKSGKVLKTGSLGQSGKHLGNTGNGPRVVIFSSDFNE